MVVIFHSFLNVVPLPWYFKLQFSPSIDSAPYLKSENEQEKLSSPKQESGKVEESDGDGSGMWNMDEVFNKGHPSNPHATVCPVALTANAIFELDEE